MKIRICSTKETDSALYTGEMLNMWGAAYWEAGEAKGKIDHRDFPAMIVPAGALIPPESIRAYCGEGGHAVLFTPSREQLETLGMPLSMQYADDGSVSFLRQTQPLLGPFSHYSLEIVGRRRLADVQHYMAAPAASGLPETATVWSVMYEAGSLGSDRPAIWTLPLGAGYVTVFAYDPVECFRDLRQGRARYAGYRPNYDDICRPSHLFGPRWTRESQAKHLPLSDFHPMLLVRLCEYFWPMPAPRFWQLPGLNRSALILSGDEDGSPPEHSEEICSFLDSLGASMTIYIQMQATKTTPSRLESLRKRGHSFSVHPYPTKAGESAFDPGGDLLSKLEWCVHQFERQYDQPVTSVRNHRFFWTGYMDIPRLWERLGAVADCNYAPILHDRGFSSLFGACSGVLPVRFLDEQCKLINVFQMPVGVTDDGWFSDSVPKTLGCTPGMADAFMESLLTHTLQPLGTVMTVNFHPGNYVKFAAAAERAMVNKAVSMGAALISEIQWLRFWQMRRTWKIKGMRREGSHAEFSLAGDADSCRLSLSLPPGSENVRMNGQEAECGRVAHFGQDRTLAGIPDGVKEVLVKCEGV